MMPVRVQLKRTKGWRIPPDTVIVDRRTQWGNWYAIQRIGDVYSERLKAHCDAQAWCVRKIDRHGRRTGETFAGFQSKSDATDFAVRLHRHAMLTHTVDVDGALNIDYYLRDLRGKNLACWCPLGSPCHADVLLELANPVSALEGER